MACFSNETQIEIDVHDLVEAPIRYDSIESIYSIPSSALCCVNAVGSHSLMSKKVKAQKLPMIEQFEIEGSGVSASDDCCRSDDYKLRIQRPEIVRVYYRRRKRPLRECLLDQAVAVKTESVELDEIDCFEEKKRRKIGNCELVKSGMESIGLRRCKENNAFSGNKQNGSSRRKGSSSKNQDKATLASRSAKKWVRDGCDEDIVFDREMIKFLVSREEMELLHLKFCTSNVTVDGRDYDEMVVLAATLDECQDFEPGDIVWAKLAGHAMWPAVIVDESIIGERKGLNNKVSGGGSLLVQFFGTHDFARYLKAHRLPERMSQLQKGADSVDSDMANSTEEGNSGGDLLNDGEVWLRPTEHVDFRHIIGDLLIINLVGYRKTPMIIYRRMTCLTGKVVTDSQFFKDENHIWPEGYTAMRKFTSLTDHSASALYKMEVLRDAETKTHPLFIVTADSGEQFKGPTPSACWNKIYNRIKKVQNSDSPNILGEELNGSGTDMFGLSNPEVIKLVQVPCHCM
nr:hypothetical protein [Arabidopsis thaliana]